MGVALAEIEDQPIDEDCVVMSVPDTARIASEGYSSHLGITKVDGIIRNKKAKRTFIEGEERINKIKKKFKLDPSLFEGKRVFIVDDSLVRSNTVRTLIEAITAQCNPKEIHLRIACPPIFSPCYYGIDISSHRTLFASNHSNPIKKGVHPYQPIESLVKSIGLDIKSMCLACITVEYPTEYGQCLAEDDLSTPRICEEISGNSSIEENDFRMPAALEKS